MLLQVSIANVIELIIWLWLIKKENFVLTKFKDSGYKKKPQDYTKVKKKKKAQVYL